VDQDFDMTTLVEANPTIETAADLLHQLGDVPPERVLVRPHPGTATEQNVIELESRHDRLCELFDGVLVEKAMSAQESCLAGLIITYLNIFVLPRNIGLVLAPDGMLRLRPGLVLIPDVSYIAHSSLPGGKLPNPNDAIWRIGPDLAIEVLSKSNTPREMARKRQEYFAAGTRLVWEFDPMARTVDVYTSPEQATTLGKDQILDGGPVLPGLSISLNELFGQLDQVLRAPRLD
jgi:Uma2 family endonuclease